jgi:hypothetical protein
MNPEALKAQALHNLAIADYARDYKNLGYDVEDSQFIKGMEYQPDLVVTNRETNHRIYFEFKMQKVKKDLNSFNRFKEYIIRSEPSAQVQLIIVNEDYKARPNLEIPELMNIIIKLIVTKYRDFYKAEEQSTGKYDVLAANITGQKWENNQIIIFGEGELEYEVHFSEDRVSSTSFESLSFDFKITIDGSRYFSSDNKTDSLVEGEISFDF